MTLMQDHAPNILFMLTFSQDQKKYPLSTWLHFLHMASKLKCNIEGLYFSAEDTYGQLLYFDTQQQATTI
jgi:hypothetical protein